MTNTEKTTDNLSDEEVELIIYEWLKPILDDTGLDKASFARQAGIHRGNLSTFINKVGKNLPRKKLKPSASTLLNIIHTSNADWPDLSKRNVTNIRRKITIRNNK